MTRSIKNLKKSNKNPKKAIATADHTICHKSIRAIGFTVSFTARLNINAKKVPKINKSKPYILAIEILLLEPNRILFHRGWISSLLNFGSGK